MSLNKVTYILLLKNDTQLKKKVTNNHKKEQLPKFIKKNKNQVFKKKTITLRPQKIKRKKKRIEKKKAKRQVTAQKKKKPNAKGEEK